MAKPLGDDPLFDDTEAAEYLDHSRGTMRNWRCAGVGPPYIKVGRRSVRYRRSALDHWLEEQTVIARTA